MPRRAGSRPRTSTCCAPWARSTSTSRPAIPTALGHRPARRWRPCGGAILTDAAVGPDPGPDLHGAAPAREGRRGPPRAGDTTCRSSARPTPCWSRRCCGRTRQRRPRRPCRRSSASTPARSRRASRSPTCRASAATAAAVLDTLQGAPEEAREDPRRAPAARLGALPGRATWRRPWRRSRRSRVKDAGPARASALLKGLILAAKGRNEEALELLEQGPRERSPRTSPWRPTVARLMQRAGRRDEAARLLTGLAEDLAKDGKAEEAARGPHGAGADAGSTARSGRRSGRRWGP